MGEYLDSLDIANRALQHCGQGRILTVGEDSRANSEVSFVYGKLRRAELRRNVWTFAVRRAVLRPIGATTFLLDPATYSATVTYLPGAIVKDANGTLWTSSVPDNLGNAPGTTTAWDQYFGPLTVEEYDDDTVYQAGELVYAASGNPGGYVIFASLENENDDDPETGTAWSATTRYGLNDVVRYSGAQYRSLIAYNYGITPAAGPADWDIDTAYTVAQTVTGSDGYIYSAVGSTTGDDPVTDGGVNWTNTTVPNAWSALPALFQSAKSWLPIHASLKRILLNSPAGNGRSVYHMPAGYLRRAPQEPRMSLPFNDWLFEGQLLLTGTSGPILFRFVADVLDVRTYDDMFCEGLAARIAISVCEALTQSTGKLQTISGIYTKFMSEAVTVNAIEQGTTEPEQDDYITVRS